MKIQVFGPLGMLGSAVVRAILRRGHEWEPNSADLEIVSAGHIHAPTVINCAGLVKQRECLPSRFIAVNALGPHLLAEACSAVGARLIHVSTDCVFSGPGPHTETDRLDPERDDDYARSKLAGEVYYPPHLTIRTSFVGFGKRGLIAELQRGGVVYASDRLLWSGHTVDTIADVLITLTERSDIWGLLHVPGEPQTRWELCDALIARYDLPAQLVRGGAYIADRRLASGLWKKYGLPDLPDFAAQLEAMGRPT